MKKKKQKLEFRQARDISKTVLKIIIKLGLKYIKPSQLFCVRSQGSKVRAYARVWGLSRIFQEAAGYKPTYVIEVIEKYFNKLSEEEQTKVLIHELMHIPKTFSGALKSHRGRYHRICKSEVEKLFKKMEAEG